MADNNEAATVEITQECETETIEGAQSIQTGVETEQKAGVLPPLTYIDFVPQCLGSKIEGKEPQFAEFG